MSALGSIIATRGTVRLWCSSPTCRHEWEAETVSQYGESFLADAGGECTRCGSIGTAEEPDFYCKECDRDTAKCEHVHGSCWVCGEAIQ